ncbi:beta-1,2-xylosyltransferase XYXT1-like [Typha latifolia]|uniref:beta-1,2-xylosyltransferase XYXT1-like n=1 Tax=Typha latifolia TaxID=4733 RepID=UPI003C2DC6F9
MGSEVKVIKNLARILSQSRLGFGLVVVFLLVLLTYFTMSEQFAMNASNAFPATSPKYEAEKTSPSTQRLDDAPHDNKPRTDDAGIKSKPSNKEEVIRVKENDPPVKFDDTQELGFERNGQEKDESKNFQQETTRLMKDDTPKKDAVDFGQFGGRTENFYRAPETKPICDTSDPKSDICDIKGDVRTIGTSSAVLLVPPNQISDSDAHEWKIKPYSRKYLPDFKEVTVKLLRGPHEAPPCSIKNHIPAVVFALGGLTGNYWHDFTDVLIPLFVDSHQFNGEVQFLITNIQSWWMGKYSTILKKLSRYEIIDFDKDSQIRCYPHVIVGIPIHKEFSIDPSRTPKGYSMVDFRKFLRTTFSLDREYPIKLRENPGRKPKLLIVARALSRRFTNVPEIVQSAERLGFEVIVSDAKFDAEISEFAKIVNSCDVMIGVHGAGLTNCVFLPTNAVMIQVVPYGKLEHMAKMDFGDPAIDMQLRYLEYSISAEESTLMDMFGKDHPIIKDPAAIHQSGWEKVGEFYLGKQDIKIDTRRFAPVLLKALENLQ